MAIWVGDHTRLLVQGITGTEGEFHAKGCRDYGTQVVGGVTRVPRGTIRVVAAPERRG
jgi:succinyl-CoA synthetase alpha subunit